MEKSYAIKHNEFKSGVVKLINTCDLPGCSIEDILQIVLAEIHEINRKQLETDIREYSLNNSKEEAGDN